MSTCLGKNKTQVYMTSVNCLPSKHKLKFLFIKYTNITGIMIKGEKLLILIFFLICRKHTVECSNST